MQTLAMKKPRVFYSVLLVNFSQSHAKTLIRALDKVLNIEQYLLMKLLQ